MKCSLKYIILLFISTYIILNICLYDNEPFINFQIISDPNKAGSINELYLQGFNEKILKDENYSDDILDKRLYANLFQKAEKESYEEMKIPESSDYSRYEVILPKEFQVPQVKYVDQRPTLGIVLPPDFRKKDSIFQGGGLPDFTPKDPINNCQGKWGEWDDDLCSDNINRCALKFREYKVTRRKKEGGQSCKYNGKVVKGGDIEYEYCFGNNNMDRCGSGENLCECDIGVEKQCDLELQTECICPQGQTKTEDGKCLKDDSTNITNISAAELQDTLQGVNQLFNLQTLIVETEQDQ